MCVLCFVSLRWRYTIRVVFLLSVLILFFIIIFFFSVFILFGRGVFQSLFTFLTMSMPRHTQCVLHTDTRSTTTHTNNYENERISNCLLNYDNRIMSDSFNTRANSFKIIKIIVGLIKLSIYFAFFGRSHNIRFGWNSTEQTPRLTFENIQYNIFSYYFSILNTYLVIYVFLFVVVVVVGCDCRKNIYIQ